MERTDPPWYGPEREMLAGWLQYHRATLRMKCDGLTPAQLCERSVPPSTMSLIGLVRHMTEVERGWFEGQVAGEDPPDLYCTAEHPDGDFDHVSPDTVEDAFGAWAAACARADAIVAAHDLDRTTPSARWGTDISLRWVVVHMIEEYARHNGHADLLRERIDGSTGD
jgi:hypothetical protein